MKGKEFLEQHDLKEGQYTGYEGDFIVTADEVQAMHDLVFTAEELAAMEEERRRDLPAVDLISDDFIAEAARLGDVDLEAVRGEIEGGLEDALSEVADDSYL